MSTSVPDPARRGLVLLAAAGVLWGTGGLLGRLLAESAGLAPFAVAALRIGLGGALLVGFLAVTGRRLPRTRAGWVRIAQTGLLAATFQAGYFVAVALTSVSLATLLTISSAPVLVLLARWRTATRQQVAGVALALVGMVLLVGVPAGGVPAAGVPVGGVPGGGAAAAQFAGAACSLLAGAGFAALTLLGTRPVAGLDDVATTGLGFVLGGLLLAPLAVATSSGGGLLDARSLLLVAALAVVPTALAYTCYFRGLRATSAGAGSVLALLEPLTGTVLAALLLGERLGPAGVLAGGVLGLAMLLTVRSATAAGPGPAADRGPAAGPGPVADRGPAAGSGAAPVAASGAAPVAAPGAAPVAASGAAGPGDAAAPARRA